MGTDGCHGLAVGILDTCPSGWHARARPVHKTERDHGHGLPLHFRHHDRLHEGLFLSLRGIHKIVR